MNTTPLILVAEDDRDVAALMQHHFQKRGCRCVVCPDGVEALNTTVNRKPDLVVLDLMMPRMDGWEVCRLLKSSHITRHIPILIVTAMDSTEDKIKGFGLGADDYLTKPFSLSELVARALRLICRQVA